MFVKNIWLDFSFLRDTMGLNNDYFTFNLIKGAMMPIPENPYIYLGIFLLVSIYFAWKINRD